jgi:hypothetical protein
MKAQADRQETKEVLVMMLLEIVKAEDPANLADTKTLINNASITLSW